MAVTGYAGMVNIKGLIPELVPPDELFANSPARFRLLLKNEKKRFPSFLIKLVSPGSVETLIPFIGAQEGLETSIQLCFQQRGRHSIGQIRVSSPFPVNFFTRYWNFRFDTACIVYPALMPAVITTPAEDSEQPGNNSHDSRGLDGELESIREYSGAEPLRSIHWKLSARGDELLVKQFGSRSAPPLVVNPESLPGKNEEERLSHAAWLIKQLIISRPVGLLLDGQTIPPDTGRRHCAKLLTELALHGHD